MRKSLFAIFFSLGLFFTATQSVYAVPVRTYGGVSSNVGFYKLKSENGGNGNLTPGSSVNVDSYLYQCKSAGTAACSTEHNNDATLVKKWQNTLTVPALNQSTSQVNHDFNSLPYGQCGRVQYDQGVVGISGAIGGWVYNFGKDCADAPSQTSTNTCTAQQPINTQFRMSGNGSWVSGNDLNSSTVRAGQQIDANCFAKNGSALLENGVVNVQTPSGQTYRASNNPELRNYTVSEVGRYTFTCVSTTINNCSDTDTFTVNVTGSATPTPTLRPTPRPTPSPSPRPTPSPISDHKSTCEDLDVIEGNNSTVPAKVKLKAYGSDNKGSIQGYRYYFGDGTRVDSTDSEITHEYTSSGTFTARVDVKDSIGNYISSNSCEATVTVRSSAVESHKYGCSDVFISADNGAKAPSLVKFTITGYDNKGDVKGYKLDFGNGVTKESDGRQFEQRYDQAGTYPVKAYVKNSSGEWVGGTDSCQRSIVVGSSTPLSRQPSTGTPTALPLIGLGSGAIGMVLEVARRKYRA